MEGYTYYGYLLCLVDVGRLGEGDGGVRHAIDEHHFDLVVG